MELHKPGVNHSGIVQGGAGDLARKGDLEYSSSAQEFLVQYFALRGLSSSIITLCSPMNIMVSPTPWSLQLILIRKLFYLCCTQELLCENNKLEGWCGLRHGFETSLWNIKGRKENLLFMFIYNTGGKLHSRDFCLKSTFHVLQNHLLAFHQVGAEGNNLLSSIW